MQFVGHVRTNHCRYYKGEISVLEFVAIVVIVPLVLVPLVLRGRKTDQEE